MAGPRQFIQEKWSSAFSYSEVAFDTALTAINDIQKFVADLDVINAGTILPRLCNLAPFTVQTEQNEDAPSKNLSAGTQITSNYGSMAAVDDNQIADIDHPLVDTRVVSGRVDAVAYRSVTLPTFDAILGDLANVPKNPDAPDIGTLPDVPTFDDVTIPTRPEISIDQFEFDGVRPTAPDIASLIHPFSYVEDKYQWSYKETIDQVVQEWLGDPKSYFALPENLEKAIFERDASRIEHERRRSLENLNSEYSARGFELPDGQLAYAHANLERETFNTLSERSRDIAMEQAKLAMENTRAAFGYAIQYEQLLVQEDTSTKQRLLEAQMFASTFSVQVAKLFVDNYNAEVQAYLADLQVYSGLLAAEMLKLEIYKTDLEAASLQVQINQQLLDLYTATLDAYIKQVDLYKAQVSANNLILEQNKLVIEQFTAQVMAYSEQVDAAGKTLDVNTREINLQVEKESAKDTLAEGTVKRIAAYNGKQENIKQQVATQVAKFEATLKEFASVNHNILQRIEADGMLTAKEASAITSQTQRNSYLLARKDTELKYDLGYKTLDSDSQIRLSSLDVQQTKYNLDHAIAQYELALKALTSVGEIAQGVASASLSAVSASAGMSSGDSFSASSSQNWAFGDTTGKQAFPIIQPS